MWEGGSVAETFRSVICPWCLHDISQDHGTAEAGKDLQVRWSEPCPCVV